MLALIFDSDFDSDPDLDLNFHETQKLTIKVCPSASAQYQPQYDPVVAIFS